MYYKNTLTVLFLLLSVFIFFISLQQIDDFDLWFHLKTGQFILENKTIPARDPFSYTSPNFIWQIHDWLATIIYFLTFKVSGFNGLIILNSTLIALVFIMLFKTILLYRNGEENIFYQTAFYITILAVLISKFRFVIRPFIFSYLFLSILLYLLHLYKIRNKNFLWCIPILIILWCNMHYGYIVGIIVLLTYTLGEFLKLFAKKYFDYAPAYLMEPKKLKHLTIIVILGILASMINPYTWHAPFYGLELQNILANFPILEHTKMVLKAFPLFAVFIVILFLSLLITIRKIDFTEFLLIIVFLYLCLSNIRFIPKFIIIASPIFAKHIYLIIQKFIYLLNQKARIIISIILFTLIAGILIQNTAFSRDFGIGIKKGAFPDKAVNFLRENEIRGNIFNPYHFGGYLNWSLYPENRIFVDGRLVFFGKDILQKYTEIASLHPLWENLLYETNTDIILFDNAALLNGLRGEQGWALIYWDNIVSIYIRNIPKNKNIISKYNYKYIDPNDKELSYLRDKKQIKINQTIFDIKKKLHFDSESSLAHLFLAICYSLKNKPEKELTEYLEALKIDKNLALAWNNAGARYSKQGNHKEAMRYFKKAVKINKYLNDAYFNIGEIYHRQGQFKKAEKYYKKALLYNNANYSAHNNLGTIYLSNNKLEDAHIEFRTAIGIKPAEADAWYNIACLYALKNNLVEFTYYFKKAIQLSKNKQVYIDLAKTDPSFDKIKTKKIYKKLLEKQIIKQDVT